MQRPADLMAGAWERRSLATKATDPRPLKSPESGFAVYWQSVSPILESSTVVKNRCGLFIIVNGKKYRLISTPAHR